MIEPLTFQEEAYIAEGTSPISLNPEEEALRQQIVAAMAARHHKGVVPSRIPVSMRESQIQGRKHWGKDDYIR